jgi:DNA-directed RNA polymerase subunit F
MPDASAPSAIKRFARDLRKIREARAISLADVHDQIQVPLSDLEAFEEGTLFQRSRMSRVYLRAFVQSYAQALEVSPEAVVEALSEALDGGYENQLAVQFLDASPQTPVDVSSDPSDETSEETTDEIEEETGEEPVSADADSDADSDVEDARDSSRPPSGPVPPMRGSGRQGGASRPRPGRSRETGGKVGAPSMPSPQLLRTLSRPRVLLLGAIVLLLAGGVGLSQLMGGDDTSPDRVQGASVSPSPPDPAQETDSASTVSSSPPSPVLTLGDTLHVTVRANAPVRGLRVQQDDDLRRPYWIEAGEAMVFSFTERITIENELDRLQLLLEQHPYPTTRRDSLGRIRIDRATATRFADTLRSTPVALPESPVDTVSAAPPGALPRQ